MLNAAGIETQVVADPMAQIWSKFVLNCAINPLTAVTGLRSGEMYRTPEVNACRIGSSTRSSRWSRARASSWPSRIRARRSRRIAAFATTVRR